MAEPEFRSSDTKAGTIGGVLLALLLRISVNELLQTALFSAVGAFVSFSVSVGMRWLLTKLKR
jgi:hypothetical protein